MSNTTLLPTSQAGMPVPPPAVFHLLDYCRERANSTLARALRETLHKLGGGAGEGISGAAFAFAHRAEREIEAAFRRSLATRFGDATTGNHERIDWHFGDRLGTQPELLEGVVTRELAVEANLSAHDAYLNFDYQIGVLLQDPSWETASNPLAPSLIAAAIVEAAQVVGAPRAVAFALTAYAMHGMTSAINVLYGELANYLVGKAGSTRDAAPEMQDELVPDDALAIEVWDATEGGTDVLSVLDYLVPTESAQAATNGATPTPSVDVQVWLADLQRVEAQALQAELAGGTLGLAPPDRTLLRALKDTPTAAQLQRHEQIVLDIVGRMFEFMLNGSGVPMGMKRVLSRLQIPVFKAALIDPEFFGREDHPARQLVNAIAKASVGWDENSVLYVHLQRKVTALAAELLQDFKDDVAVFERALSEFDAFQVQQQRQPDRVAEALMSWLQREEDAQAAQDNARHAAETAIIGRVADPEVHDSVRQFLCREWIKPLQAAHLVGGITGAAWQEAVSMMDDLIWSVRPKLTHESRSYLVKMLPGLLRRLQQQMNKAGISQEARDEFMSRLVICHAQAVKSGFQPEEAQPAQAEAWKVVALARAAQTTESVVVLPFEPVVQEYGDGPIALRFVDPRAVSAAPLEEPLVIGKPDASHPSARELAPGVWLSFKCGSGGAYLARLKWVSPAKRTYLFVDREGRRVATMAEVQLDIALRGGAVSVVAETPLVNRAMEYVMDALKHAAAA